MQNSESSKIADIEGDDTAESLNGFEQTACNDCSSNETWPMSLKSKGL